ncbi:ferredoxin [Streptomyces sp. MST-110588]|uniref:ferredoxin n=1 Tax=Streptomyces sp. MST-110588 TaxID=2833628 RepID=UPI001F5CF0B7|nr:ferredoxin [Streptomyces sp. MST-110588]UNO42343.1 ferredoxin [Streptomyces sp. MST-110588]
MAGRWRVEVDRTVCVGSGMCAATAPGHFRLDATRRSQPVHPETEAAEPVLSAAEGCPVEAITLTAADSGAAVFPPDDE